MVGLVEMLVVVYVLVLYGSIDVNPRMSKLGGDMFGSHLAFIDMESFEIRGYRESDS